MADQQELSINEKLKCNIFGKRILLYRTMPSGTGKSFAMVREELRELSNRILGTNVAPEPRNRNNQVRSKEDIYLGSLEQLQAEYATLKKSTDQLVLKNSELEAENPKLKDEIKRLQDKVAELEDKKIKVRDKRPAAEEDKSKDKPTVKKKKDEEEPKTITIEPDQPKEYYTWENLDKEYYLLTNEKFQRYDLSPEQLQEYLVELNVIYIKFLKANGAFVSKLFFPSDEELYEIRDNLDWDLLNKAYNYLTRKYNPDGGKDIDTNQYLDELENILTEYLLRNEVLGQYMNSISEE